VTTRRTMLKAAAAAPVALTTAATAAAPAEAAPPTSTTRSRVPGPATLQAALDGMAPGVASGALAEVRHGSWMWRGASGVAELGTSRPVRATGRFRAASVTKSFVATVVLQLVGERRLALTDPVDRFLPGALANGNRITVHQLLQHTSGVPNYDNRLLELYPTVSDLVGLRYRTWRPSQLLALAAQQTPEFAPGTSWAYSNTNYILLGLIVQQVTGRSYAAEVRHRILRPLDLHDTELPDTNPSIRGPHSHGYLPLERDGAIVPIDVTVFNHTLAWAAGEMVSTTHDLNRFYRALHTGRLLQPAQLAQMRTTAYPDINYGLGLEQLTLPSGQTLWGHGGGTLGYQTLALSSADGRRQLSLSFNPWGDADPGPPLQELLFAAFSEPLPG
jgi:D-alanyl-D-alanine carboxypeptidase